MAKFELCGSVSAIDFDVLQTKSVKDKVVTRIIVSRCEVDLMKIRTEFKRNFGKSLHQTILVSIQLYKSFLFVLLLSPSSFLSALSLPSFKKHFNQNLFNLFSLSFSLQEHTKGDYQRALLNLCGGDD